MPAPSFTYQIQWYIDIADGAETGKKYVRVTEDEAFDMDTDESTYSPSYKCNKVNPEYVTARKVTVDFDVDIVDGQDLQEWFKKHEDDMNVPTSVVRVWEDAEGNVVAAKKADFAMTEKPIDGEAEGALKATGTLTMTSDGWTEGTFDKATNTFVPKETIDTPAPDQSGGEDTGDDVQG